MTGGAHVQNLNRRLMQKKIFAALGLLLFVVMAIALQSRLQQWGEARQGELVVEAYDRALKVYVSEFEKFPDDPHSIGFHLSKDQFRFHTGKESLPPRVQAALAISDFPQLNHGAFGLKKTVVRSTDQHGSQSQ